MTATGSAGAAGDNNGGPGGAVVINTNSQLITLNDTSINTGGGAKTGSGTAGDGGLITLSDQVNLDTGNVVLSSGARGGTITFAGPVNSTSTRELSIPAGTGDVDFDNTVGATNALSKITVSSAGSRQIILLLQLN